MIAIWSFSHGRITLEYPGGYHWNGWADKNGISGRLVTDYAIEDREDELVMGNTPKGVMNQSRLDHDEPNIPAKIFSHPNKNGIEQDGQHNQQRDSQQKDAPDDDGHDINHNFSTN
ncbi:MAG: hypothetical protein GY782_07465 [Gammaproteobacteria bacterium]|nr:hypothetical protein [Gammaproteobacteria bacterium]